MARMRFTVDPGRSRVEIAGSSSVHPIHAAATGLEGWIELDLTRNGLAARPGLQGEVRIAVERLRSGNPLVDRETRRRIDAKHHPHIAGRATGSTRLDAGRLDVRGQIQFRGVTTDVAGELSVLPDGTGGLVVSGEQSFDVRAWGLDPPKVGPLQVHPEITVRLQLVAVPATD